jgi:hypothetical protein
MLGTLPGYARDLTGQYLRDCAYERAVSHVRDSCELVPEIPINKRPNNYPPLKDTLSLICLYEYS